MSEEKVYRKSTLSDHFVSTEREPLLYEKWIKQGIFCPEAAKNKTAPVFNISMPPPNANGELHLGHAFGYTVMDILGRYHRLLGERVMLLPGKDHAGIQTQVVFEKKLQQEKIDIKAKSVQELYDQCYAFCTERAQYMRAQEKRIGLSADWERELFTLDPRLNEIVFDTFVRMWNDGLVYKGSRIVNWSVFSQTSISDVEVEYKEQDGGLWYLAYKLEGTQQTLGEEIALPSGSKIRIGEKGIYTATTRPETMLGDTALAVHPEDKRYKHLVGKFAIVPIVNRRIPIVADKRVDQSYGTGVIKVTPAHDFADYDMGVDHKLEAIQVIGKDGRMTAAAGPEYVGKKTGECREAVVSKLTELGLLLDQTTIKHKVPIGERGKDIIEPLISEQWFINVDKPGNSLKGRALELVRSGKIAIYPERFRVLFEQWLENLRDWNISRQLWWGHRLPVWYKRGSNKQEIYAGVNAPNDSDWEQETDIFDTWFSSGQWAYSTIAAHGLTNLEKGKSSSDYFPTHTMVMGRDILLFWACRMLLLTAYRISDVPWKNIYFTGLIRDEHGQKMSKSKGNGIDPNNMIDKYGADSLRLGLVMGASPGNDLALSERKIEGYSKFINKIWNAAKLVDIKLGELPPLKSVPSIELDSSRWILAQLESVHRVITTKLASYEVSIAADEAYNFTWSVFCDWYLEMMKVLVDKGDKKWLPEVQYIAVTTLRTILTMLHPFVPYVTEEIYSNLSWLKLNESLASAEWSYNGPKGLNPSQEVHQAMEAITAIRSIKAALTIPQKRIRFACSQVFSPELSIIVQELARADLCNESDISTDLSLRKPYSGGVVVCEVEGKTKYKERLEKDRESNKLTISSLETKLAGSFATQAKPEVVAKERERLEQAKRAIAEIEKELSMF